MRFVLWGTLLAAAPVAAAPDLARMTREAMTAIDRQDAAAVGRLACPDAVQMRPDGVFGAVRTPVRPTALPPGVDRSWGRTEVKRIGDSAVVAADTTVKGAHGTASTLLTAFWANVGSRPCLAVLQRAPGGKAAVAATWDEAFQVSPTINREPNRWLMKAVAGAKPGRALDVATGQGRNAIALAKAGWTVTGFDVSGEGLRLTREGAAGAGVKVDTVYADADAFDFGRGAWDLVVFMYAPTRGLERKAFEGLAPGGLVVAEAFHNDSDPARAGGGVFWSTGELRRLFETAGFETLAYEEAEDVADYGQRKVKLVRLVARKPRP